MRHFIFVISLVMLTACVPTVKLSTETSVIPNAEQGTVVFGDYQTYFERIGRSTGQPVLMVHGIGGGSSIFQYRLNAPTISYSGYNVYALDLLGFGRSSRPAIRYTQDMHISQIASFIETKIGQPTILVANSLSAAYSIRLAAERPDLVKALVLISPTGYSELSRAQDQSRINQFNNLSGFLGEALYSIVLADNWQRFFLLDAYASDASLTPEVLKVYDQNLKVPNAKWVVLSFISGNLDQDVSAYWPTLTQPSQIIWGQLPGFVEAAEVNKFLEARPDVSYVPIEGAKLLPNEDKVDEFNQAVLEFLNSLD
jgi:pimeloyl-ACP methyl ester carboxylesterase